MSIPPYFHHLCSPVIALWQLGVFPLSVVWVLDAISRCERPSLDLPGYTIQLPFEEEDGEGDEGDEGDNEEAAPQQQQQEEELPPPLSEMEDE